MTIALSNCVLCRTLFPIYLQMDLKFKFVEGDISDVIKVNEVEVGKKYPISKARRIDTKYGESVLLTI